MKPKATTSLYKGYEGSVLYLCILARHYSYLIGVMIEVGVLVSVGTEQIMQHLLDTFNVQKIIIFSKSVGGPIAQTCYLGDDHARKQVSKERAS